MNVNIDTAAYHHLTGPSRLDKAVNSLLGLLEGIAVDSKVNDDELGLLVQWVREHQEYATRHPFTELLPVLSEVLADGILTDEERSDLVWLCERLRSTDYYDAVTADMQRLHALVAGVAADGVISENELRGLSAWLAERELLRTCWPYDEIDGLVTGALSDGKVDPREQQILLAFFSEFLATGEKKVVAPPLMRAAASLQGVCASCPEIRFTDSLFCYTGASARYTRSQFAALVPRLGGRFSNSVTRDLNYLVVGAEGNPCWSYACYGRKVEKAVDLRKQGVRLLIVHENDFHDAVADAGVV